MVELVVGHRARVPPDPVPNSEVKPCSVPNCSAVFGRVKSGKPTLLLIFYCVCFFILSDFMRLFCSKFFCINFISVLTVKLVM